jgi:hypothetical protein
VNVNVNAVNSISRFKIERSAVISFGICKFVREFLKKKDFSKTIEAE